MKIERLSVPVKIKPHKGTIHNWTKLTYSEGPTEEHLGFVIFGTPHGHPSFTGWIRTSLVVKFDEENKRIETLNSIYDLGEPFSDEKYPELMHRD